MRVFNQKGTLTIAAFFVKKKITKISLEPLKKIISKKYISEIYTDNGLFVVYFPINGGVSYCRGQTTANLNKVTNK